MDLSAQISRLLTTLPLDVSLVVSLLQEMTVEILSPKSSVETLPIRMMEQALTSIQTSSLQAMARVMKEATSLDTRTSNLAS